LVFNGIAGWGSPILLLLSGALLVLFAGAIYRFVEVPLHPLRRRLTGHAKAP
jgi:peptidoglycan/LPS O-acetylase OafA/YrhL